MTQPVQEPTPGRVIQGLDFRTRQLFRRPSFSPAPAWAVFESTTTFNTAVGTHAEDLPLDAGNVVTNNSTVFSVDGSDNLKITGYGSYQFNLVTSVITDVTAAVTYMLASLSKSTVAYQTHLTSPWSGEFSQFPAASGLITMDESQGADNPFLGMPFIYYTAGGIASVNVSLTLHIVAT